MSPSKTRAAKPAARKSNKTVKKTKRRTTAKAKTPKVKTQRTKPTSEIASIFSVTDRTVHGWVKRGCPHTKGKAPVGNRFDEAEVAAWLKAENIDTCKPGRPLDGDSKDLRSARLRKENALAAKYELQVAKERGLLLVADDVKASLVRVATQMRNAFLGLGASVSPSYPDVAADLKDDLDRRVKEILFDFSQDNIFA